MTFRKKEGLYYDTSERTAAFKVSEWLYNLHPLSKVDILGEWMSDMYAETTNALVDLFILWSASKHTWMNEEQEDKFYEFKIGSVEAAKYEDELNLPSFEDRFKKFLDFHNDLAFNPPENLKELCRAADDKIIATGSKPLPYKKQAEYEKTMKNAVKNSKTLLN